MAMNNTLGNWVKLYNLINTVIVGSLILFASIINGDVKWFSTLISAILVVGFVSLIPSGDVSQRPNECSLVAGAGKRSIADLNTLFVSFVATFMIYASFYYDNKKPYLVLFFLVTLIGSIYTRSSKDPACNTGIELACGLLFGVAFGIGFFYVWNTIDKERFTYFYDSDSTDEKCTRPNGQRFKCSVYKGGELIQDL